MFFCKYQANDGFNHGFISWCGMDFATIRIPWLCIAAFQSKATRLVLRRSEALRGNVAALLSEARDVERSSRGESRGARRCLPCGNPPLSNQKTRRWCGFPFGGTFWNQRRTHDPPFFGFLFLPSAVLDLWGVVFREPGSFDYGSHLGGVCFAFFFGTSGPHSGSPLGWGNPGLRVLDAAQMGVSPIFGTPMYL